ncbi:MAG: helicase HerA domain-containing protein, partial [Armatimonadota bacterium]
GRTILPPAGGPATVIATNLHRDVACPLRVPLEHRFKHTYITGMTGTGKSTFMLNLLLQDLQQGHGLCLIDPHGELADELLSRFPKNRERDLVLIDFADRSRIVPLNFLHWSTEEERDIILDDLYRTLDRVYDFHQTGGPILKTTSEAC